jgi:hypothetical protein
MKGELSYALSIAHIEILYCSTMKHILEIILAFLTGLYCYHCAGAVAGWLANKRILSEISDFRDASLGSFLWLRTQSSESACVPSVQSVERISAVLLAYCTSRETSALLNGTHPRVKVKQTPPATKAHSIIVSIV